MSLGYLEAYSISYHKRRWQCTRLCGRDNLRVPARSSACQVVPCTSCFYCKLASAAHFKAAGPLAGAASRKARGAGGKCGWLPSLLHMYPLMRIMSWWCGVAAAVTEKRWHIVYDCAHSGAFVAGNAITAVAIGRLKGTIILVSATSQLSLTSA